MRASRQRYSRALRTRAGYADRPCVTPSLNFHVADIDRRSGRVWRWPVLVWIARHRRLVRIRLCPARRRIELRSGAAGADAVVIEQPRHDQIERRLRSRLAILRRCHRSDRHALADQCGHRRIQDDAFANAVCPEFARSCEPAEDDDGCFDQRAIAPRRFGLCAEIDLVLRPDRVLIRDEQRRVSLSGPWIRRKRSCCPASAGEPGSERDD